jgi:excisionase family DNA binding protein
VSRVTASGTHRGRSLDVGQVAERLGVTEHFVRRLIKEKRITYVKLGPGRRSPVRVTETALDDYIAKHTIEARH